MKTLVLFLSLLVSSFALADMPSVTARDVSCQELKDMVANYKSVKVYSRFLGLRTSMIVKDEVRCSPFETRMTGIFKTKDIRNCQAGEYCMMRDRDFDIDTFPCHGPSCL